MYLKEFEGSAIFAQYGIGVPLSCLVERGFNEDGVESAVLKDFLEENPGLNKFAVKAQLLRGHRGKSGAIVFAERENLIEKIKILLSQNFDGGNDYEILVEEKVDIAEELYLSITLDRFERCFKLIFSKNGGIDIEETAKDFAESIFEIDIKSIDKKSIDTFYSSICRLNRNLSGQLTDLTLKVIEIMKDEDALLVEINPLAITRTGRIVAVDSKIVIDDNALFRHREFASLEGRGLSKIEKKAQDMGLAYVELDGDLAVIGNGAGLVMSTLDVINYYEARAANFCDVGGGASGETMAKALEIVLSKKSVKKILINIFGGITHCDEIAMGIVDAMNSGKLDLPMCVRIVGTNENQAFSILEKAGVRTFKSFEEAVKEAASL